MLIRQGKIVDSWTLSPDERRQSIVETDDWRKSRGRLIAMAVPCIIVAAHNEVTREGLVGHFSSVSGNYGPVHVPTRIFDECLPVVPTLGPLDKTTVWLGGGCEALDEEPFENFEQERTYALCKLGRLGIAGESLTVRWSAREHEVVVQLECPTGTLTIQDKYYA